MNEHFPFLYSNWQLFFALFSRCFSFFFFCVYHSSYCYSSRPEGKLLNIFPRIVQILMFLSASGSQIRWD